MSCELNIVASLSEIVMDLLYQRKPFSTTHLKRTHFDNDGRIRVGDIMQVAARWNTRWGDPLFDRRYDLDDDGDVDIVDIMRVAARWEEVC